MLTTIRKHNGSTWEVLDARNLDGITNGTTTISASDVGNLTQLQTTNNHNLVSAINEINKTIGTDLIEDVNEDNKQIKRLIAYEQAKGRVIGGSGVFVDVFDGKVDPIAKLDTTKTKATSTLSVGNTTIPVQSITGFAVGQEITVFDDVNIERPIIKGISGSNLTVTALTKNFKNGATICRSSVVVDTVNKCLKFGGWDSSIVYDRFSTVVSANFSIYGNGARKLTTLSNGWIVAASWQSTGRLHFLVSKDNGGTFTGLCHSIDMGSNPGEFALTSYGTYVYTISSASYIPYLVFDALTVSNTNLSKTGNITSTGQDAYIDLGVSFTIDQSGILHASWAAKGNPYGNSYNIRYAKGNIGANGSVTWGGIALLTTYNTSGFDAIRPCVVILKGNPIIVFERRNTQSSAIMYLLHNGTAWQSEKTIHDGGSYEQSSPCAVTDKNDVIHLTWCGTDSTDTGRKNIRYSKLSTTTWSTPVKLTSGNAYGQLYPTLTSDKNNKITVLWEGRASGTYNQIRKITSSDGGSTWSSIVDVTSQTTANASNPSALVDPNLDFTEPLFIYQDGTNVKFKGTWSVGSNVPVKVEDVRYNLTSPTGSLSEVVAWVKHEKAVGFMVDGSMSLVDAGQNESYTTMTKTIKNVSSVLDEDQFVGSFASPKARDNLRFTLSRTSTTIDKKVIEFMGAIE